MQVVVANIPSSDPLCVLNPWHRSLSRTHDICLQTLRLLAALCGCTHTGLNFTQTQPPSKIPFSPPPSNRVQRFSLGYTDDAMELTFLTDLGQSFVVEIDPNMELENVMALLEAEVSIYPSFTMMDTTISFCSLFADSLSRFSVRSTCSRAEHILRESGTHQSESYDPRTWSPG